MAKRSKKRLLRSPGILLVAFTVLLSMSGLVWAHWTDTLEVRGQVDTGFIDIYWTEDGTSDDGVGDPPGGPFWDGEPRPAPDYQHWGPSLASGDLTLLDDGSVVPLTKDVGRCTIELVTDGAGDPEDRMLITIENAYPSYWCEVYFDLHNRGTVPLKMQELFFADSSHEVVFTGPDAPFQFEVPGSEFPHLEFGFGTDAEGPGQCCRDQFPGFFSCGYQIDPGQSKLAAGYFHLGNDAAQDATYWFELSMDWVNWNEYDEDACLASYPFPLGG